MVVLHCDSCHHEWEGYVNDPCEWCFLAGRKTGHGVKIGESELQQMMDSGLLKTITDFVEKFREKEKGEV